MAEVNNKTRIEVVSGKDKIVVNAKCSHHSISIEATDPNSYSIKCKEAGLNNLMTFDSNALSSNTKATFVLPGIEMFEITPSDLTKPYTVQVHSF